MTYTFPKKKSRLCGGYLAQTKFGEINKGQEISNSSVILGWNGVFVKDIMTILVLI